MRVLSTLLTLFLLLPGPAYASGNAVILASDSPADSAAAGALGEKLGINVMTTPWGTLSDESILALRTSGYAKAYVVGGSAAVPDAEETLAQYDIAVERLGGEDRYETSALVALKWNKSTRVYIVDGRDTRGIEDASAKAGIKSGPILFVRKDTVTEDVADAIAALLATEAVLLLSPDTNASAIAAGISKTRIKKVEAAMKQDLEGRTRGALEDAEEAILRAEAGAGEIPAANALAASQRLEIARENLNNAHDALAGGDYAEAFSQAIASKENAEYSSLVSSGVVVGVLSTYVDAAKRELETKTLIGEITGNPLKHAGKDIQVTGIILSDPVYIGEKTYIELSDATGTIIVEKKGFMGPPFAQKGDTITVTGTISINPTFGGPHGEGHANMPSYILTAAEIEHVS